MDYRIGIIDDDKTKITQLITYLSLGWEDNDGNIIKEKYKDVNLIPIEIDLESNITAMVDKICEIKPDALIIDFKLSSQENIAYSGVALTEEVDKRWKGFPIFILTSYQDDLYTKEVFDVYQVFDFERYISDIPERIEINSKIVEQIRKYVSTIERWKAEIAQLMPRRGKNVAIDSRIMELDSLIENSIDGVSAIPQNMKQALSDGNQIQKLIDKLDQLINDD